MSYLNQLEAVVTEIRKEKRTYKKLMENCVEYLGKDFDPDNDGWFPKNLYQEVLLTSFRHNRDIVFICDSFLKIAKKT